MQVLSYRNTIGGSACVSTFCFVNFNQTSKLPFRLSKVVLRGVSWQLIWLRVSSAWSVLLWYFLRLFKTSLNTLWECLRAPWSIFFNAFTCGLSCYRSYPTMQAFLNWNAKLQKQPENKATKPSNASPHTPAMSLLHWGCWSCAFEPRQWRQWYRHKIRNPCLYCYLLSRVFWLTKLTMKRSGYLLKWMELQVSWLGSLPCHLQTRHSCTQSLLQHP